MTSLPAFFLSSQYFSTFSKMVLLKKITGFIFITFLLGISAQAQNHSIDSLKVLLKKSTEDTNKVSLLDVIGSHYQISSPDIAMMYANQELKLSEQLNFKKGIAQSYLLIGTINQYRDLYEEALKYYLLSLEISKQISDKRMIANTMTAIGIISQNTGETRKAIDYYERSLKIREEIGDKHGIAACLNNLSGIYYYQGDIKTAKKYALRCLKIGNETGNKSTIANALNGLASISMEEGNLSNALEYYKKALKMCEEMQNYYEIAMVLNNIGETYNRLKNFNEALICYKKSLDVAQHHGILELEADAMKGLALAYEKTNNYKLAYQYGINYSELKDSMFILRANDQILEMSTKYEAEKKQKEIELLSKEKEKQAAISAEQNKKKNIIVFSSIAVLILVTVFSLFLFNRFNVTRKQKHIIEQKQKEITDSITYAKRLQTAILPPHSYWQNHLPNSFVLYQPKDIVSGDFYWLENANDLVLFAAADCTGHGVSGAMVSVVCSNALNRTVKEFNITQPNKILDKARELVLETFAKSENDIKDGMDISLCCLNTKKRQLHWSGANNPLWYISKNTDGVAELIEIKGDKQPIGKNDNPRSFTLNTIQLQKQDTIYIFTDGYADQFGGEKNKKFMYKPLKNLLLEIHHQPFQIQKEILQQRFENWKSNTEQTDDVLIIGIQV